MGYGGIGGGVSRLRAWLESKGVKLTALVNVATVSILVLTVVAVYFLNYRPYRAAQLFPVQSTSLERFIADAQRSFETFPPLATLPRQVMFDTLLEHWERVGKSGEASLLRQLQAEGEEVLKSEPKNARLYLSVARLFQQAGPSAPAYVPLARHYVEVAQELAPGLLETIKVVISQEVAEEKYAEALTMIYDYRGTDPVKARHLSAIMNEAQNKLIGQIGIDEYMCRWAGKEDLTLEERDQIQCKEKPTS